MENKKFPYKHLILRAIIFLVLIPIASVIALFTLDPERKCGTGDILTITAYVFLAYCLWAFGLFIEAYFLNRRKETNKRNLNIIMALSIPFLLFLVYIYIEIIDVLDF